VIGEEPSDTEEMPHRSLAAQRGSLQACPQTFILRWQLWQQSRTPRSARHEASLEATQAVAAVVAATMDVVISPDEINQRLVAGA